MAIVYTSGAAKLFKYHTQEVSAKQDNVAVQWKWETQNAGTEITGYALILAISDGSNDSDDEDDGDEEARRRACAEKEDVAVRAAVVANAARACVALAQAGCPVAASQVHVEQMQVHSSGELRTGGYLLRVVLPEGTRSNLIVENILYVDQLKIFHQLGLLKNKRHLPYLGNHDVLQKYSSQWAVFGLLHKLFTSMLAYITTVQDVAVQTNCGLALSIFMVLVITTKPFPNKEANSLNLMIYTSIALVFAKAAFASLQTGQTSEVPESFMAAFVGCPLMYQFYNLLRKHVERLRQQNVEALVDYYVKLLNYMDLPAEQRQVYKTVGFVEAVRFRRQDIRLFQSENDFPWKVEKMEQQALCSWIPNWCRCFCLAKTETHWRVDDETCAPKELEVGQEVVPLEVHGKILLVKVVQDSPSEEGPDELVWVPSESVKQQSESASSSTSPPTAATTEATATSESSSPQGTAAVTEEGTIASATPATASSAFQLFGQFFRGAGHGRDHLESGQEQEIELAEATTMRRHLQQSESFGPS
eukprot:TRINITY_DN8630_c0_g1_i2.p1 TRINITY_DN8630_c0_g1~~TRINITY_DN8630_c0_g1_i2.p1  ORF type:complete len:625 (-),score=128.13 TRINITY_DN8630_c0_g1_i2:225-1820(-)